MEKVTQTSQRTMMKVQQKITRYGVGPVATLAGTAPGPEPRTDPPSTTGQQEKRSARHIETCKTHANGNQAGPQCQSPISGNQEAPKKKKNKKSETLNILQFNASGIQQKKKTVCSHFR